MYRYVKAIITPHGISTRVDQTIALKTHQKCRGDVHRAMFFLLLIYYNLKTAEAAPVPVPNPSVLETILSDNNPISRSLINVIYSCMSTILACTWLSIHPNLPESIESESKGFRSNYLGFLHKFVSHKLPIFAMALLVPEYILAWAIRQWFVASEIANAGRAKGVSVFTIYSPPDLTN